MYLKLDKKLIVKGENLIVLTQKSNSNSFSLYLKAVEYIPKIFQQISLKNVFVENSFYNINYQNSLFKVESSKYSLLSSLQKQQNSIKITLHKFTYKPYNLSLQAQGNISKDSAKLRGKYNFEGIRGEFTLYKSHTHYLFTATSKTFTIQKLKKLFTHFSLHKQIKIWSYKNIQAKSYILNYLKINYDTQKRFNPNDIEALVTAKDVTITFHPNLPFAFAQKVNLHYLHDNLYFQLLNPIYQNKSLQGSSVIIKDLTKPSRSHIQIVLKTTTPFDPTVQEVLRAYQVDIPITQKQGSVNAKVIITLYFLSKSVNIRGDFIFYNSSLLLDNIPFYTPQALVLLRNQKLVFTNSPFRFFDFLSTHTQGWLDLQRQKGKFIVKIDNAKLQKDGVLLLNMQNVIDRFTLDLAKKELISEHFPLTISFQKEKKIIVHNLAPFLPYSPLVQTISPLKGNVELYFPPSKKILLKAQLLKKNTTLLQNGKPITHFLLKGEIAPKTAHLQINNNITINIAKKVHISCRNFECNISKSTKKVSLQKPVEAVLKDVVFIYTKYALPFDKALLQVNSRKIELDGRYKKSLIHFQKRDTYFTLTAQKLEADFINHLLNKKIFSGGEFFVNTKGEIDNFSGNFRLHNTHIKNLKALNNLFAFINSLPALMTFHNPGFDKKGFYVKKGSIEFLHNNGIIFIKKLFLESYSLNIEGSGIINLYTNQINFNIKLITFKSITNIINKIPIAGYILLGDEGNAYTTLHLSGSINNPKIATQLTKDTLTLPLNIIKRALQLPFKIFQ